MSAPLEWVRSSALPTAPPYGLFAILSQYHSTPPRNKYSGPSSRRGAGKTLCRRRRSAGRTTPTCRYARCSCSPAVAERHLASMAVYRRLVLLLGGSLDDARFLTWDYELDCRDKRALLSLNTRPCPDRVSKLIDISLKRVGQAALYDVVRPSKATWKFEDVFSEGAAEALGLAKGVYPQPSAMNMGVYRRVRSCAE